MSKDTSEPRFQLRSNDVVWRRFGDQAIALDLRSSRYLETNATATVLWRELEHGATRAQLIDALLAEFEVSPERAQADVDRFLRECSRRGLLLGEDSSSATGDAAGPPTV